MVSTELVLSIAAWLEACEAWLAEHQETEKEPASKTLWPMVGQTGPLISGIGQAVDKGTGGYVTTTSSVWANERG